MNGPLPELYPRFDDVEKAKEEIAAAISTAIGRYDLTLGEVLSILLEEAAGFAKSVKRGERHGREASHWPKSDKGADEI